MDVEEEHLRKKPRIEFDPYKEPKIEYILETGQEIHEREWNASEQFINTARQVRAQQDLAKLIHQEFHGTDKQTQAQVHPTGGAQHAPEKHLNAEHLLNLARVEVEHIIHTITMIQENYLQLNHYQAPKVHDATQTLLLGHKQAALSRAANRLRDRATNLLEQSAVDHASYWDVLVSLRSRWHLRAAPRTSRVVVDHGNSTIGPSWSGSVGAESTDTPISLTEEDAVSQSSEGDLFVSVPFRPSFRGGSLSSLSHRHHQKYQLAFGDESKEKRTLIQNYNVLLTQKHTQHICAEIFQQLLGEVSGESTKVAEGAVHIDSATTDSRAHLLIRKNLSDVKTSIVSEHTLPYILSIVTRSLLLARYKNNTPILPSVISLFHHAESLVVLTEKLEALALQTPLLMHWKPSFITISQSPFQFVILHSVCLVQTEKNETNKGPLVVHLEGSNIYCVTTNPVHTVPLSTPDELEQFIVSHLALNN